GCCHWASAGNRGAASDAGTPTPGCCPSPALARTPRHHRYCPPPHLWVDWCAGADGYWATDDRIRCLLLSATDGRHAPPCRSERHADHRRCILGYILGSSGSASSGSTRRDDVRTSP